MNNIHTVFPYLFSIWAYIENFHIFKTAEICRSLRNFPPEVSLEAYSLLWIAKYISYIVSFWSML